MISSSLDYDGYPNPTCFPPFVVVFLLPCCCHECGDNCASDIPTSSAHHVTLPLSSSSISYSDAQLTLKMAHWVTMSTRTRGIRSPTCCTWVCPSFHLCTTITAWPLVTPLSPPRSLPSPQGAPFSGPVLAAPADSGSRRGSPCACVSSCLGTSSAAAVYSHEVDKSRVHILFL